MKEKIAVLVDTCMDVPAEYLAGEDIYVIPMIIQYKDRQYIDKEEISVEEVCRRLPVEVPTTSLPSLETMQNTLENIKDAGYDKVIAITISSGLSGTNNALRMVAEEFKDLEIAVIDTKNIGFGAGFSGMLAIDLLRKGLDFHSIVKKVEENIAHTKIFFCVDTLEYLKKGGRIGLVTGTIGTLLDLKPIISCNEDGIYYTVGMAKGRKQSLKKNRLCAQEYASRYDKYNVVVVNVAAKEEAAQVMQLLQQELQGIQNLYEGTLSSALAVHTGPGIIGVGIQRVVE